MQSAETSRFGTVLQDSTSSFTRWKSGVQSTQRPPEIIRLFESPVDGVRSQGQVEGQVSPPCVGRPTGATYAKEIVKALNEVFGKRPRGKSKKGGRR